MTIAYNIIGGYDLIGLTDEELSGLLSMIRSANLPERRTFNGLRQEIEKELSRR